MTRSGLARGRDELESQAVVAPALARGSRPVVENVSLMSAAAYAVIFRSRQYELHVLLGGQVARDAGEKARPAGPAFEFHLRGEEGQRATRADEYAGAFFAVQGARERPLGGLFTQYRKLRLRKGLPPLGFGPLQWRGGLRDIGALGQKNLPVLPDFGERWRCLGCGCPNLPRPADRRQAQRRSR